MPRRKKATEIICLVDRSGSMTAVRDDSIGGFNDFLEKQQELPGDANLTYAQFNTEYEIIHDAVPIKDVPSLTKETFVPRGWTALLDAIGRTINTYSKLGEKVLMVILTDGQENSSKEFSRDIIKRMIEEKRDAGWEFIFIGADEEGIEDAVRMGIPRFNTVVYCPKTGTRGASGQSLSSAVQVYRQSGTTKGWNG